MALDIDEDMDKEEDIMKLQTWVYDQYQLDTIPEESRQALINAYEEAMAKAGSLEALMKYVVEQDENAAKDVRNAEAALRAAKIAKQATELLRAQVEPDATIAEAAQSAAWKALMDARVLPKDEDAA